MTIASTMLAMVVATVWLLSGDRTRTWAANAERAPLLVLARDSSARGYQSKLVETDVAPTDPGRATRPAPVSEISTTPSENVEASARSISFDIHAQSLASALKQYTAASKTQLFYETPLTAGRQSAGLKGSFTAEAALQALLAGTGIAARRTDIDAFILVPIVASPTGLSVTPDKLQSVFIGALQNAVVEALCRNVRTRSGGYGIAAELWIARTGIVEHSALIGSTGDADRDAALLAALGGAVIGVAPPDRLPQPYIVSIAPRSFSDSGDCAGR
uniref:Secretin/TonB short N-terminal domain protein n=1 Tax=Rhodopseudomonas palustris (strain BisA53) TaxID=316055 RepID=Q07N29_RHOP5